MAWLDRVTDRLLALLGLEMDFAIDLQRTALSEVREHLFVGSRPRRDDVSALQEAGITHVVSCLRDEDQPTVAFLARDFEHLFVAVHDGVHEDIAAVFPAVFDFATRARAHADSKLLVHCEAGVSRSATLAIALVMTSEGTTFLDAFTEVRRGRPEVLPNIGFASQLQRLEHELHPHLRDQGGPSSLARYLRDVCKAPVDVETLQDMLEHHDHDAARALTAIFGDDIPRVVQGVRL